MPLTLQDLDDPVFNSLPPTEQYKGRAEVFHDLSKNDPLFRQLPIEERRKVLFPVPIEEPQNPLNQLKPLARAALTIGPPLAAGAALFTPAAPFAIAPMVATGLVGAGSEYLAQKIFDPETNLGQITAFGILSAFPGARFAGITSIPGRVALRTAEGGFMGLGGTAAQTGFGEGRLPTAGEATRGTVFGMVLGAGAGTFETRKAIRELFGRGRAQPAGAPVTGDAPAGLAEEVFGPVRNLREELSQFESFTGKVPQQLQRDIAASEREAQAFMAQKFRGPPLPPALIPEIRGPITGEPISVGPLTPRVPGPPIRMGTGQRGLPSPEMVAADKYAAAVADDLAQIKTAAARGLSQAERDDLAMLAQDLNTDSALRAAAADAIRTRLLPPPWAPPLPPKGVAGKPSTAVEPLGVKPVLQRGPLRSEAETEMSFWNHVKDIVGKAGFAVSKDTGGLVKPGQRNLSDWGVIKKSQPEMVKIIRPFGTKGVPTADEVAEELFNRGLIEDKTEAAFLKAASEQSTGRVVPGFKPETMNDAMGTILADIKATDDVGRLLPMIEGPENYSTLASGQGDIAKAAFTRAKIILDNYLKGNFGKGPYTVEQVKRAAGLKLLADEQIAKRAAVPSEGAPPRPPGMEAASSGLPALTNVRLIEGRGFKNWQEFLDKEFTKAQAEGNHALYTSKQQGLGAIVGPDGSISTANSGIIEEQWMAIKDGSFTIQKGVLEPTKKYIQGLVNQGKEVPPQWLAKLEPVAPSAPPISPAQRVTLAKTPVEAVEKADILGRLNEADLNNLAFDARKAGNAGLENAASQEITNRVYGARPSNPNPIDDLAKAERDGTLAKILGNERGAVWFGQNPRTNSIREDREGFFNRMSAVSRSFRDIEVKDAIDRFWRRITSGQEMAKQHPEFKLIYQPFHAFPRKAVNAHVEDAASLFDDPRGQSYFNLYKANEVRGGAVDAAMIQSRLNRQGQPRMSDQMLQARGFDGDQIRAYNSVLDYGERILQRHKDAYVERKLETLVNREVARQTAGGQAPLPMDVDQLIRPQIRARLEAEANEALRGLDHWVPFYRSGEKTIWVFDSQGKTKHFDMAQTVRERVDLAKMYRDKFPAAQGYTVKEGLLEEFAKSKAFDEIDLGSLEVLARFARIDPTITEEFIGGIRPQLMSRSRALERQLHAKATPGFKEDLREGLISVGSSAHHYIERQKAKDLATEALGKIDPRQKPELFKFAQQYIDENLMPGNKLISKIMNATYTYYMAGSVKYYPLQLSQIATVVYPRLTAFVNDLDATKYIGRNTKVAFGDFTKQRPEKLESLRDGFKLGVFQPRAEMFSPEPLERLPFKEAQIEQAMAQVKSQAKPIETRYYEKFRDTSMLFVTDADFRSRVAAYGAFFDVGREKLGLNYAAAVKFAEHEANGTSYLYGRADSPQLFGRTGPLQLLNVFRSWNANYASFLRGNFLEARRGAMERIGEEAYLAKGKLGRAAELAHEKEFGVIARSVGIMFGLGGVLYNMPTVFRNAVTSAWGVDPETEMRRFMAGKFGITGRAAEGILRGAPAALGIDMSRSLSFGDMFPGDALSDVLGAPFSMMERILRGAGQLFQAALQQPFGPDIPDALELLSPAFMRNIIRGTGTMVEGVRTKRGGVLPGGEFDLPSRVGLGTMQALGFQPTSVVEAKALQRASQAERQYHDTRQSRVLEDLASAIIAQRQDRIDRVTRAIETNNQKAIKESRPDLLITVDNNALRQLIAEMMTPQAALKRVPKVMRQRELERQQLFLGPPPPPPMP